MAQSVTRPLRQPKGTTWPARLTLCEVLCWIGLGEPKTKAMLDAETAALHDRWTEADLRYVVAALNDRAAGRIPQANSGGIYDDVLLSPRGPELLHELHRRAEQRLERTITDTELAALAGEELLQQKTEDEWMALASHELMEALRGERIVARGQPSDANGQRDKAAGHVAVPLSALLHPQATLSVHNYIGVDDGPESMARRGLTYHDITFALGDVLNIWSVQYEDTQAPQPPSVLIDKAVAQIMERTGCPEDYAVKLLLDALRGGEISARREWWLSVPPKVPASNWANAEVNLETFRTESGGGLWLNGENRHLHYVRLDAAGFDWWLVSLHRAEGREDAKPKRSKSNGIDYREKDAPLIAEMHDLISHGKARSPQDAARAVAKRAAGNATDASKVERLANRYRTKHPGQPD